MGLGEAKRITKPIMVTIENDYLETIKACVSVSHKQIRDITQDMSFLCVMMHRIKEMYPSVYGECILNEDGEKLSEMASRYNDGLK